MIIMSEEEFVLLKDNANVGICTNCHEQQYDVEPDAGPIMCESCGAKKMYGIETLIVMGQIRISHKEEEEQ